MSQADCPHCGARNFAFLSSADLTRCRDCGRILTSENELDELRDLVADARRRLGRSRTLGPPERSGR